MPSSFGRNPQLGARQTVPTPRPNQGPINTGPTNMPSPSIMPRLNTMPPIGRSIPMPPPNPMSQPNPMGGGINTGPSPGMINPWIARGGFTGMGGGNIMPNRPPMGPPTPMSPPQYTDPSSAQIPNMGQSNPFGKRFF